MNQRPAWAASRVKRAQVAAIAAAGYPLIATLARTFRWDVDGREHLEAVERGPVPPIFAFFHGRILPGTAFFARRGIVVITSENFDGEWIARIIQRFGYGTARGSSSRGGIKALVQLKREIASGRTAAFTVDGPRGPAEVVQPGAVWLARATGAPILPFHFEAERYWSLRSWDRTQVPKPWSRVVLSIGAPMIVLPTPNDDEALERERVRLEGVLLALKARALDLAGRGKVAT